MYVLVFTNIDFWEYLWLATQRPMAVFAYTSGRLVSRMVVVITLAYFFHQVKIVLWGLIVLESVRLVGSAVAWKYVSPKAGHKHPTWGLAADAAFLPADGGSNLLSMSNRYAASIFVAKAMGPVALAHYTIGTYVEPIIITLRNSLSDALLPAIVNRGNRSQRGGRYPLAAGNGDRRNTSVADRLSDRAVRRYVDRDGVFQHV